MATNFFTGATVDKALTDNAGNATFIRCTVANLPTSAAGYAVSCLALATDTGAVYVNTGSITSATWTLMDTASTSLQLPEAATDATTTSGTSLALTQNTVTTGIGLSQSLNGLTTGEGHLITHTTSVIADGGSLLRVTSSGINTGGATNGTLFDFKATGQLEGTLGRIDTIQTTGTAVSIISTGVMTTTGNLLTLTANSATTAAGLLRINANSLTDGIGAVIASSATAMTATGRLLSVSHSGATTASGAGILSEFSSAATDATTIVKITASAANAAGSALTISTATTTGTGLTLTANSLTSGKAISVTSSSASTDGGTSFEPALFSTTMTGAGGVGGRVRAYMTTNVALGAWSNALKGEVTYGAAGKTTGLGSSVLAEMTLSAGTVDGTYAPLEVELNLGSNSPIGTNTSFLYASANGTATNFIDSGVVLNLQGLGAAASGKIFQANTAGAATHALKILIGGTLYYIMLTDQGA